MPRCFPASRLFVCLKRHTSDQPRRSFHLRHEMRHCSAVSQLGIIPVSPERHETEEMNPMKKNLLTESFFFTVNASAIGLAIHAQFSGNSDALIPAFTEILVKKWNTRLTTE